MIAELHDIRPGMEGSFLSTGSQNQAGEIETWSVTVSLRRELLIFFRRFGLTFRSVLREWLRWGWPTIRPLNVVSSASTVFGTKYFMMEEAMPHLDVARQEGSVVVRLNARGVKREDVRVEFFDGVLMLSGVCMVADEGEIGRRETFFHNVTLPAGITAGNAQIRFQDDALEVSITIPRPQESGEIGVA